MCARVLSCGPNAVVGCGDRAYFNILDSSRFQPSFNHTLAVLLSSTARLKQPIWTVARVLFWPPPLQPAARYRWATTSMSGDRKAASFPHSCRRSIFTDDARHIDCMALTTLLRPLTVDIGSARHDTVFLAVRCLLIMEQEGEQQIFSARPANIKQARRSISSSSIVMLCFLNHVAADWYLVVVKRALQSRCCCQTPQATNRTRERATDEKLYVNTLSLRGKYYCFVLSFSSFLFVFSCWLAGWLAAR